MLLNCKKLHSSHGKNKRLTKCDKSSETNFCWFWLDFAGPRATADRPAVRIEHQCAEASVSFTSEIMSPGLELTLVQAQYRNLAPINFRLGLLKATRVTRQVARAEGY